MSSKKIKLYDCNNNVISEVIYLYNGVGKAKPYLLSPLKRLMVIR